MENIGIRKKWGPKKREDQSIGNDQKKEKKNHYSFCDRVCPYSLFGFCGVHIPFKILFYLPLHEAFLPELEDILPRPD